MHASHAVLPSSAWNVPAAHLVGSVEPVGAKEPASAAMHCDALRALCMHFLQQRFGAWREQRREQARAALDYYRVAVDHMGGAQRGGGGGDGGGRHHLRRPS